MQTLKRLFMPDYSELTLFVMGYTCLLFLAVNISSFRAIKFDAADNQNKGTLIVLAIILAGILLSIFNAFIKRRKTSLEKIILLLFAVLLNGFSGIWAGTYLLGHTKGILLVFPIWNILSSYILIATLKDGAGLDENRISDKNAKIIEVFIGALIATAVFFVSKYAFHDNWAVTFSFSVAYATNINEPIVSLLSRRFSKK